MCPHIVNFVFPLWIQSWNFLEIEMFCFCGFQNVKNKDVKTPNGWSSVEFCWMRLVPVIYEK